MQDQRSLEMGVVCASRSGEETEKGMSHWLMGV
jgi:hypothetical protein